MNLALSVSTLRSVIIITATVVLVINSRGAVGEKKKNPCASEVTRSPSALGNYPAAGSQNSPGMEVTGNGRNTSED
ncbi:hypothetical protein MTO96_012170 [Rhipicephalus appendiculatus]